ncbi:P-type DNA transfer protein VirB5 [Bartonella elizabethae]|uniref:type IV secretion system protein n=1 Tax=Bartonella elizabethae TaxID=807 RepID=UPI000F710AD0|nr:type IV secretion system protein [Bartonella elizabethae]VEJ42048.1 P-type DNA transfer protein VirB5 [Bartonella elizabethae]
MKKRFILTGMMSLLAMLNLALTANFSWGSAAQTQTVQTSSHVSQEEYLKIIELLTQQIKTTEDQIKNAEQFYKSITGNKIQKPKIHQAFFLRGSLFIYPTPHKTYIGMPTRQFRQRDHLERRMTRINIQEWRGLFLELGINKQQMYDIINRRLQYSGIVDKAVSLQAFEDVEKRFTQITNFVNDINKTKDLREVFDLQTRIRNMSAVLQNEYAKLQMVRNLSDNEELLIEIQKHKLYEKVMSNGHKRVPELKF